jgi:hypothetical protein
MVADPVPQESPPARAPEPPREPDIAPSPRIKPPPSNNKSIDRAQKALWTNQPAVARSLMTDLLKQSGLTRRDRARASKLLGDAEVKLGHKAKAVSWYRKSFQLYDDPEERAKVARILQNNK